MKKVKSYKGFIIALNKEDGFYYVFTKEEYAFGAGLRYSEIETGSVAEAIQFIDSY